MEYASQPAAGATSETSTGSPCWSTTDHPVLPDSPTPHRRSLCIPQLADQSIYLPQALNPTSSSHPSSSLRGGGLGAAKETRPRQARLRHWLVCRPLRRVGGTPSRWHHPIGGDVARGLPADGADLFPRLRPADRHADTPCLGHHQRGYDPAAPHNRLGAHYLPGRLAAGAVHHAA